MVKRKPCPIPGCKKRWETEDSLFGHLYYGHIKSELTKWIVDHLEK